jgi:hypothetical protein
MSSHCALLTFVEQVCVEHPTPCLDFTARWRSSSFWEMVQCRIGVWRRCARILFFYKRFINLFKILYNSIQNLKIIKIKNRCLDHLAMTIIIWRSRRHATVLASPLMEPAKTYHSRACLTRHTKKIIVLNPKRPTHERNITFHEDKLRSEETQTKYS